MVAVPGARPIRDDQLVMVVQAVEASAGLGCDSAG